MSDSTDSVVLHRDAMVVDCHNDLVLSIARHRQLGNQNVFRDRWIPSLRAGGINVQVAAVYADPIFPEAALRQTLLLIEYLHDEANKNSDEVMLCVTAEELHIAVAQGKIAIVLALEGAGAIANDLELLTAVFRLGVRMGSFTWFGRTALADGSGESATGSRLTTTGVYALQEMERLGMVVDISHLSDSCTDHVLELARRPVVASHSSARAICHHHRNLTDEQLRGVANTEGVVAVNFFPAFVDSATPTVDRLIDHIIHIADVAGIDHVGLGPDFVRDYYMDVVPNHVTVEVEGTDPRIRVEGLSAPEDLPLLTQRILARGFSPDETRAVLGTNLRRVFEEIL